MSLRGSFGGFYFVIAGYGKIKSSENDRKIAVSAQTAAKLRLMENLGLVVKGMQVCLIQKIPAESKTPVPIQGDWRFAFKLGSGLVSLFAQESWYVVSLHTILF